MTDAICRPNFRSPAAEFHTGETLFKTLLDRSPLPFVLMTSSLRIVNANDAFLAITQKHRDALAGVHIFDAFPPNPADPDGDGIALVRSSFERVLRSTGRDVMPTMRHDISADNGAWEVRHWQPTNWAVPGETGAPAALVEHVSDVTAQIKLQERTRFEVLADLLLQAHALNQEELDEGIDKAVRMALMRVGHRLAQELGPQMPYSSLN